MKIIKSSKPPRRKIGLFESEMGFNRCTHFKHFQPFVFDLLKWTMIYLLMLFYGNMALFRKSHMIIISYDMIIGTSVCKTILSGNFWRELFGQNNQVGFFQGRNILSVIFQEVTRKNKNNFEIEKLAQKRNKFSLQVTLKGEKAKYSRYIIPSPENMLLRDFWVYLILQIWLPVKA